MSDQAETQSPPMSIEDRVANSLGLGGDQPEVQPEQQAEAPPSTEPEYEEVEYEGERFQVPPKLKKGLMLNEDYTRKTQELSDHRKAVEITQQQLKLASEQQAFRQQTQAEYEQVALIDNYLKQVQQTDWQGIGVEELLRKRAEVDQLKDRKAEILEGLSKKEREFMDGIKSQYKKLTEETEAVLSKRIQNWGPEVKKDVTDWAISQGFTSEEVQSITNPVHAETLWKARQYDKLLANKDAAVSQASKATPMGKPGSSTPMPQHVKDKLNFQRQIKKLPPNAPERRRVVEDRVASIFSR